jgi:hypothetical protein
MWNPFKRKHLVPMDDCFNAILESIKRDDRYQSHSLGLWEWLEEKHGVKQQWSWRENKNYIVFDNESDYVLFLMKL